MVEGSRFYRRFFINNSPIRFLYAVFFFEHFVEAGQSLAGAGKKNYSTGRTVETMGYSQKNFSRFIVFLFDVGFNRIAKRAIAGFVALHNFRAGFVYRNYMIVF